MSFGKGATSPCDKCHLAIPISQAVHHRCNSSASNLNLILEGPLLKWTNYVKGWQERYFFLSVGELRYAKARTDKIKDKIDLRAAVISLPANESHRIDISCGGQSYWIKCPNQEVKQKWINGLHQAKAVFTVVEDVVGPPSDESTPLLDRMNHICASQQEASQSLEALRHLLESSSGQKQAAELARSLEALFGRLVEDTNVAREQMSRQQDELRKMFESERLRRVQLEQALEKAAHESYHFERRVSRSISNFDEKAFRTIVQSSEESEAGDLDHVPEEESAVSPAHSTVSSLPAISESGSLLLPSDAGSVASSPWSVSTPSSFADAVSAAAAAVVAPVAEAVASSSATHSGAFTVPVSGRPRVPRSALPVPSTSINRKVSLWSVLKDSIGKDLSKLALPVAFNEPLSMLQRLSEDLEFSSLLDQAAASPLSTDRLIYVAAFAICPYSSTQFRTMKPFNPILGETFELVDEAKGFRFVAEQVSHHPPISAGICESRNWVYSNHTHVKSKFWGKSMDIIPQGSPHILFPSHGDDFTWTKATSTVHNLIMGKLYLEHHGTMVITNRATGDVAEIELQKKKWFDSAYNGDLVGVVKNNAGLPVARMYGTWKDEIKVDYLLDNGQPDPARSNILIWQRAPLPPQATDNYNWSEFTMALNEVTPELRAKVAPTDTRLRPDQRALEEGNIPAATQEKSRLEEKQRQARKAMEKAGQEYRPRWFTAAKDDHTGENYWIYSGNYWEQRERGQFSECPDLF
eukprot:GILI01005248.1.p1 GENE.GILI01005248.1~~GILI01005248.1.p1  ORF type:complete len:751 (-),score=212.57 GILI01005248.1:384-2636(-)